MYCLGTTEYYVFDFSARDTYMQFALAGGKICLLNNGKIEVRRLHPYVLIISIVSAYSYIFGCSLH